MDISTKSTDHDHDHDDDIVIALYSIGIKVTNKVLNGCNKKNGTSRRRRRKGIKIHIAVVNIKTNKEILAFLEVTDEKAHDGRKIMPRLIKHILKRKDNKDIKIKSVLGDDGSYDSNENFKYLQKKRIMPCIKVRKNSIISSKNNKLRNREVINQTKDLLKWKKKKDMDRDGLLELFSLQ